MLRFYGQRISSRSFAQVFDSARPELLPVRVPLRSATAEALSAVSVPSVMDVGIKAVSLRLRPRAAAVTATAAAAAIATTSMPPPPPPPAATSPADVSAALFALISASSAVTGGTTAVDEHAADEEAAAVCPANTLVVKASAARDGAYEWSSLLSPHVMGARAPSCEPRAGPV